MTGHSQQPARSTGIVIAAFGLIGILGMCLICSGLWLALDLSDSVILSFSPPTSIAHLPTSDSHSEISASTTPSATRTPTLSTGTPTPASTNTARPTSTLTLAASPSSTRPAAGCSITVTGTYAFLWSQYKDLLGCPLSAVEQGIQDAEQQFQNGHLFWRSDSDRYYAIYDGGGITFGSWASYSRQPGAIQNCPQSPPGGLWKPTSGFGDIWCFLGGANSPLGWGLDHEYGFLPSQGIRVQDFERGLIFRDSNGAQVGLVYVLTRNGFYRVAP